MTTSSREPATPGGIRELLHVAVPLVLSSGSLTLMQVIDRIFLTWYSNDALAAALPAAMLYWTIVALPMGTVHYVNTFVAQYEGAGRPDRVGLVVWQGIYFSIITGLVIGIAAPLAWPLCHWIGHAPAVQEMEAAYLFVLALGSVPSLLSTTLSCFYSGRSQTIVVMWANLVCSLVNIVLDPLLIFGAGPIPALGIWGAGIATVIAQTAMLVFYLVVLLNTSAPRTYLLGSTWNWDSSLLRRLARYGLPNGFQMLADGLCFSLFILVVGQISQDVLAATNLAFNLNTLAFLPMLGVGTALMTLVGRRIGEGRPQIAIRTVWSAFGLTAGYMLFFAAIYVLLPELIILPYSIRSDPKEFEPIRQSVVVMLRFIAVYSLFDAMALVFSAAIRGAGDTAFAVYFTVLAGMLIAVVPTYVGVHWFGGGMFLAWTACTVYIVVLGIGFLWRFQSGYWQTLKVIEEQPDPAVVAERSPSTEDPEAESQFAVTNDNA